MATDDSRTRRRSSLTPTNSRKDSLPTNSSLCGQSPLGSDPVRIFEHYRYDPRISKGPTKFVRHKFPKTFNDVVEWLEDIVQAAQAKKLDPSDTSSSIQILFLDEIQCGKYLHEDNPLERLLPMLKVMDWNTSHYQTTFCRFPRPLDLDGDEEAQSLWDWRYTISHPFDWEMLWVYLPTTRTNVGIMRTWFDGYDTSFNQMEAQIMNFRGRDFANPMLLGIFALQILTSEAMKNTREKGNTIYEAQTFTGFHKYERHRTLELDSDDDQIPERSYRSTIVSLIGAVCNLTGWNEASQQLMKYVIFIKAHNQKYVQATSQSPIPCDSKMVVWIDDQADKLVGDVDGAFRDIQAWLSASGFILQGVLNLLKQQDTNAKISLAKDQARIAEEVKRDSTSMNGIACVTMIYLPGTFTAVSLPDHDNPLSFKSLTFITQSFFALPFLEHKIGLAQFWIYWLVTIPLTLFTLFCWYLWKRHRGAHSKKEFVKNVAAIEKIESKSHKILSLDPDLGNMLPKYLKSFAPPRRVSQSV